MTRNEKIHRLIEPLFGMTPTDGNDWSRFWSSHVASVDWTCPSMHCALVARIHRMQWKLNIETGRGGTIMVAFADCVHFALCPHEALCTVLEMYYEAHCK